MNNKIKILILLLTFFSLATCMLLKNMHENYCCKNKNDGNGNMHLSDLVNFKMSAVSF